MDAVEQKILAAVDAQRETLLAFAQDIGAHAEPGFFETRTAARVAELLRGCGLSPQTGLARTSVKAVLSWTAFFAPRTPPQIPKTALPMPAGTMRSSPRWWAPRWR